MAHYKQAAKLIWELMCVAMCVHSFVCCLVVAAVQHFVCAQSWGWYMSCLMCRITDCLSVQNYDRDKLIIIKRKRRPSTRIKWMHIITASREVLFHLQWYGVLLVFFSLPSSSFHSIRFGSFFLNVLSLDLSCHHFLLLYLEIGTISFSMEN